MHPSKAAFSALIAAGLMLGLGGLVEARERGGWAGPAKIGGHWHSPRHHRGPFVPLALDRRHGPTVIIQQVFVSQPPPRVFSLPTVLDLPVQLGIREAKPAEPALYVLNEGVGQDPVPASVRSWAGPRIIEAGPDSMAEPGPAFGAKIIHLSVPVGEVR